MSEAGECVVAVLACLSGLTYSCKWRRLSQVNRGQRHKKCGVWWERQPCECRLFFEAHIWHGVQQPAEDQCYFGLRADGGLSLTMATG